MAYVFLFLPPTQHRAFGSRETRNNIDLCVSEANVPFIEDGPANVASGFFSVLVIQYSTAAGLFSVQFRSVQLCADMLLQYDAQGHQYCTYKSINLGWILREIQI